SDDIMTADMPTWSTRVIVNPLGSFGGAQGSVPRFFGHGSGQAYVTWFSVGLGLNGNFDGIDIYVAASPNKGFNFSDPVRVNRGLFIGSDYILGNDRVNNFPSMAVDTSNGPFQANVYVVYANNNNGDGADVVFHRSVDGGATFSPPVYLNSNPGFDREQWFPYVTVDSTTGRISVIYYDQGIATSGDLTELTWTYSDDGGVTWSKPSPLSPRPFHAGYGNDANQPNLGDYIGAVAQNGSLYAAYATTPDQANFADGQDAPPNGVLMPYPNVSMQTGIKAQLPLSLGTVTFTDSDGNGHIDPGEQVHFQLPLRSYATNPMLGPETLTGVAATLSTTTAGVTVTKSAVSYGAINSGVTVSNPQDFIAQIAPGFVPGTKIEFTLAVSSPRGTATLPFTQITGTPVATQIFAEDFESVAPGALPAGWTAVHQTPAPPARGGVPPGYIVPWTTDNSFCGATSNGLFHVDADDGPASTLDNTRWERAFSPMIQVPADAEYVTLDFDICYDTEDDPEFSITDYDGAFLRITDLTNGRTPRSVLTEAFADSIQTGSIAHFPKHFPSRNDNPNYFDDMSNWGGYSNGFQHVSMRLPGMAGSTIQLRWEYTQDESGTCADVRFQHTCGVIVDNIVMNSVVSQPAKPPGTAPGSGLPTEARAEAGRQDAAGPKAALRP
ncbi:MAG TPA: hypothetical protein VEV17_24250, partial [Bryobacteraceae bacterium]|nr:hypothetical protein [Bryobacteraceae bacterium]